MSTSAKGSTSPRKKKTTKAPAQAKRTPRKSSSGSGKQAKRQWISRPFLWKLFLVLTLMIAGWVLYLDATIRDRFEGQRWDIPARVYARPLEIFEGAVLNADLLEVELKGLGYKSTAAIDVPGTYYRQGQRYQIFSRGFEFADSVETAKKMSITIDADVVSSLVLKTNGTADIVRLDPLNIGGIYPAHHEDRIILSYEQIPELLPKALVAIEDKDFWSHFGLSPKGIARALWVNISAGEVTQGGSTLTQQLVKNFYLDGRRTLWRKVQEAVMSVLLDWHYQKQEILEVYLNEVYLGQSGNRGIHGFGLASQFYFSRSLNELEAHQIALLVAMVKGPTYYNPRRNPERALSRRNLVIEELAKEGIITAAKATALQQKPLDISSRPVFSENLYPAFMDLVRRQLNEEYRQEDLESRGLKIFTTIDPQIQNRAEKAIREILPQLDKRKDSPLESALVLTGLESGEVKAFVGGRETRFAGFNRVLDARRPIGSLAKPAVYLTALSNPARYTLATRLKDEPISKKLANGDVWQPQNYEKKSFGDVSVHQAFAHSMNLASAQLGFDVGIEQVLKTLRQLGVTSDIQPYPSVFLGAFPLSPYEVAQAYQTIAASGFNVPVRAIREVTNAAGETVSRYPYQIEKVVDSRVMHLLQYAMQETMREGTGKSAYRWLPDSLATAGKTGTTNDARDSWFAGMTGDYLSVVWVGKDDNGKTDLTGATGSMRIWAEMMQSLPQRPFSPIVPEGINYAWVADDAAVRTNEGCRNARYLPFVSGSEPVAFAACQQGLQRLKSWFEKVFE